MRSLSRALLVVLVLTVTFVPGCRKKVGRSNYEQIRTGMKSTEVTGWLGRSAEATLDEVPGLTADPHLVEVLKPARWLKWQQGERTVFVGFIDDRVVYRTRSGF
jgi:hypothetical protein